MSHTTYRLAFLVMLASAIAMLATAFGQPWASLAAQAVATVLGAALVLSLRHAMRDAQWDGFLPLHRGR